MKKIIALLMLIGLPAYGEIEFIKLSLSNIATNGTNDTVSSTAAELPKGYLDSIYVDVSASSTNHIEITTVTNFFPVSKALFTHTNITADAWFYPRTATDNGDGNVPLSNTGQVTRLSLVGQKIQLGARQVPAATNKNVAVYIFYEKE